MPILKLILGLAFFVGTTQAQTIDVYEINLSISSNKKNIIVQVEYYNCKDELVVNKTHKRNDDIEREILFWWREKINEFKRNCKK